MVVSISSESELVNILKTSASNYKLLIIDFYATWCGPCLMFAPEFERMSKEFSADADFIKVDCDKLQNLAMQLGIKVLPTVKGFCNMQEVFSLPGAEVIKLPIQIRENIILPMLKTICLKNINSDHTPQIYLLRIVDNIINHPNDENYRRLKLANLSVQQNLLAFEGMRECLMWIGFREVDDQLMMEETSDLELFKQIHKQLTLLVATPQSKKIIPQTSNANVNEPVASCLSVTPAKSRKDKLPISNFNLNAEQFLRTINSYRTSIDIYENVDLINIVNVLVDIDQYKESSMTPERVLKNLLRWFKYDFFSWFNTPNCGSCNKPYDQNDRDKPTLEESKWLAHVVELYRCRSCSSVFRFPRYNHPEKLLITRTGRCGEWANCFSMVLRAFINEGIFEQARIVHDWTDHVWCEIFLKLDDESEPRWIHVDPCEGIYNAPLTYKVGWGKKIDYVMAITLISGDVQDVTWRYTNDFKETLANRKLIDERVLVNKLVEFHKSVGADYKKIFQELLSFLPMYNEPTKLSANEMMGRTTGSEEWRMQRGELGNQPIWKRTCQGQSIIPTQLELKNNCIHIQYNCSVDSYERPCDVESSKIISGEGETKSSSSKSTSGPRKMSVNKSGKDLLSHDTEGWQSLAASWTNIQRKVEYDWQVVYLARMKESPAESSGEISWIIDLTDSNKKISEISIFASSAEFHNATVKWKLHSAGKSIPINGFVTTTDFNDCSVVTLSALLQSDPSNNDSHGWQHAQLCRQKSTDFDVKTLQIKIELTDG